jgi:hypothetical protein
LRPRAGAESRGWFDPIVGCRLRVRLRERLTEQVRGDIGGFDIGEASRFTWNVEALLEVRCSTRARSLAATAGLTSTASVTGSAST